MIQAKYYTKLDNQKVQCNLCPHNCIISPGKTGKCKVRINTDGDLFSYSYQVASSIAIDPIEKKPLYHFYPGKDILSIGSFGCNFSCQCCQNHEIAQNPVPKNNYYTFSPDDLIDKAKKPRNNIGIAFTYNEPIVWFEYMLEIAKKVKENHLKSVMVSNGFIKQEPLRELIPFIDAFNIDIKTYDHKTYQHYFDGNLNDVLSTLQTIVKNQKHLELTYLLINGINDDELEFSRFVEKLVSVLGKNIVLHISRAFPRYKSKIEPTDLTKLHSFYKIAKKLFHFVFLGNVYEEDINNTYCPYCKTLLISRNNYSTTFQHINPKGTCLNCNKPIVINM